MSMSYNKLHLPVQGCKNDQDSVERCLQSALASLKQREFTPDKFTVDTFGNANGTPSWINMSLAQRLIVQHMATISTSIETVNPDSSSQLIEHVITPLVNPMCYASLFPATSPTLEENGDEEPTMHPWMVPRSHARAVGPSHPPRGDNSVGHERAVPQPGRAGGPRR